jgi:protein phosphatase
MKSASKGRLWATSHRGYKRSRNEDRYLARPLDKGALLAVADGMGGETGGDTAAQAVVDTLQRHADDASRPAELDLCAALQAAGREIADRVREDPGLEGMGTTATVVLVAGGRARWCHVGDSRLYLYRAGSLEQITTDHTFVQELLDDGTLTQEEAASHPLRNVLDQCVGCAALDPDNGSFPLQDGDRLLLCSDGLTRHVTEQEIASLLAGEDPREIGERLVRGALNAGGKDNVTVAVWLEGR